MTRVLRQSLYAIPAPTPLPRSVFGAPGRQEATAGNDLLTSIIGRVESIHASRDEVEYPEVDALDFPELEETPVNASRQLGEALKKQVLYREESERSAQSRVSGRPPTAYREESERSVQSRVSSRLPMVSREESERSVQSRLSGRPPTREESERSAQSRVSGRPPIREESDRSARPRLSGRPPCGQEWADGWSNKLGRLGRGNRVAAVFDAEAAQPFWKPPIPAAHAQPHDHASLFQAGGSRGSGSSTVSNVMADTSRDDPREYTSAPYRDDQECTFVLEDEIDTKYRVCRHTLPPTLKIGSGDRGNLTALKPWMAAAREFVMNFDFDLPMLLESGDVDLQYLLGLMMADGERKLTVNVLNDKSLQYKMLSHLRVPQMPVLLDVRNGSHLRNSIENFVDVLCFLSRRDPSAAEAVVKPTHLYQGFGSVIIASAVTQRDATVDAIERHVSNFLNYVDSDVGATHPCRVRPGFLAQPKYRSIMGFGLPLKLRVVTLWGKSRVGVWWWGREHSSSGGLPHRNAWFTRCPSSPDRLSDDDRWIVSHKHPGGNHGYEVALDVLGKHMPVLAKIAERVAVAIGAPFLQSDFFVGDPAFGVRLNKISCNCTVDVFRPQEVMGAEPVDDAPMIAQILAEGMTRCRARAHAQKVLGELGVRGNTHEELTVLPVWKSEYDDAALQKAIGPHLDLRQYAVTQQQCQTPRLHVGGSEAATVWVMVPAGGFASNLVEFVCPSGNRRVARIPDGLCVGQAFQVQVDGSPGSSRSSSVECIPSQPRPDFPDVGVATALLKSTSSSIQCAESPKANNPEDVALEQSEPPPTLQRGATIILPDSIEIQPETAAADARLVQEVRVSLTSRMAERSVGYAATSVGQHAHTMLSEASFKDSETIVVQEEFDADRKVSTWSEEDVCRPGGPIRSKRPSLCGQEEADEPPPDMWMPRISVQCVIEPPDFKSR